MDRQLLQHCESEALHLSGAIQPHGMLLVADAYGLVGHVSLNAGEFSAAAPAGWLGQSLPEPLASFLDDLGFEAGARVVGIVTLLNQAGREVVLDVTATRSASGHAVIELTPASEDTALQGRQLPHLPPEFADESQIAEARRTLVEEISILAGAHRVMYYEFQANGDGSVIEETREEAKYGSYLGLRFPASDIPQIARNLYLKNPWRLIQDIAAVPVAIVGRDGTPPDLSWSDLRSVSPVHAAYLANMGVRTSLSFPVVAAGNLSALIAVHYREPLPLARSLLEDIAARVRMFSLSLASFSTRRRMRLIDNLSRHFDVARQMLRRHGGMIAAWPDLSQWLMEEMDVDGVQLCDDDRILAAGDVFEPPAIDVIDDWFIHHNRDLIWMGDSLMRQVEKFPLSQVAGAVAVRLSFSEHRQLRLYLTRLEHVHEVAWGGNPDKPAELHSGDFVIAPRRSFEKWVEKRMGYSRPWSNESRLLALKLRELLLGERLL